MVDHHHTHRHHGPLTITITVTVTIAITLTFTVTISITLSVIIIIIIAVFIDHRSLSAFQASSILRLSASTCETVYNGKCLAYNNNNMKININMKNMVNA